MVEFCYYSIQRRKAEGALRDDFVFCFGYITFNTFTIVCMNFVSPFSLIFIPILFVPQND